MIHNNDGTPNHTDSLIVAIAGHTGFVGQIVVNQLNESGIKYYKIPSFRFLNSEEISLQIPAGKISLINCSGSTLQKDSELSRDIYVNNTESLKKLVDAFAERVDSVLHMSTAHLNVPELTTLYTEAKKDAEKYLIAAASKYSFKAVNLRLPTIWSSRLMKVNSLLDEITVMNCKEMRGLIRNPAALIQVAPETSLEIQVQQFLLGEIDRVGFDNSNSWTGSIAGLIDVLCSGDDPYRSIENELRRILNVWRLARFNS